MHAAVLTRARSRLDTRAFVFSSAFRSVLALGVDLDTRFGSGFWLRPAANMTCLALASDSM
jgi:hypothetical protein